MSNKRRFVWLLALPFAIVGGCFLAIVFYLLGLILMDADGDMFAVFIYSLWGLVGLFGAIFGAVFGLVLGLVTSRKWGAWGAVLAGLFAAVIGGVAGALFFSSL